MSTLEIALSLAAQGWHVFACSAAGKPIRPWKDSASTDSEVIKGWFAGNERIGVHCGLSGLLVVDLDRKNGKDGFASLKQAGLKLRATMNYTSRSGNGKHYVYRAPAGITCTIAGNLNGMAGVDIRAGVGMVIYSGPALTGPPALSLAPQWAVVPHKAAAYQSAGSLEAWLAAESRAQPTAKARGMANAVPLDGVDNPQLLNIVTPLVSAVLQGYGRRRVHDIALERYTRRHPAFGGAFDQAWSKAIARVESDWTAAMQAPPTVHGRTVHRPDLAAHAKQRRRQLELTPASAIKPRPVEWLWDGRLGLGTLSLLAGREGIGKSTCAYWIAARVTRGELPGQFLGKPRGVLIAATEDSWEHTIIPRLMAAQADLDKVFRVEVRTVDDIHVGLSLPHDIRQLEQAAQQTDAGLLLLDPLMSRLGEQDTHKDAEVRIALEPLVAVADTTGMTVLGIMHHNKSNSTDPLQLVMGSKAFTAVARSVHTVVIDPDDDTEQRKLFGTPKNNLGRTNLPTLTFVIVSTPVDTETGIAWTGRVVWGEEITESIGSVMGRAGDGTDKTATSEAADWLLDFLTLKSPVASAMVKNEGAKAGHTLDALKRARQRIKAVITAAGFPRTTYWGLPVGAPVGATLRGDHLTALTAPTGDRESTDGAVGAAGAAGGGPPESAPTRAAGRQRRKPTTRLPRATP